MKKNKGFTLVELLAVLVILGIVALVSIPAITGSLKSYKYTLYETQIKNIENAARVWGSDHIYELPNDENSSEEVTYSKSVTYPSNYKRLFITLGDLQNEGYIDKELKSVKSKGNKEELISPDMIIVIEKSSNKLEYTVIDGQLATFDIGDAVSISLNDNTKEEFFVIEDNGSKKIKAILKNDSLVTNSSWCGEECVDNQTGAITINKKLEQLNWSNALKVRLITVDEVFNVLYELRTDPSKIPFIFGTNGAYWTNTIVDNNYAYTIAKSNGYALPSNVSNTDKAEGLKTIENSFIGTQAVKTSIKQLNKIRPVVEIDKKYVNVN